MALTMPDERPSLTRMLSCRHSNKVSCETLSLSDAYLHDNLQSETQSFHYTDDEKDHMKVDSTAGDAEANELENPNYDYCKLANDYLRHVRELENHSGKLDNPSYGDGKAARDNVLSRFLSKVSHMHEASRAKEAERLRKHLRIHPSAIRRTGGVVSQSGRILLHIGSHSGAPNSKAPATLRASSIIPRNAVVGKMNTSAGEPSSPKVTCLGRVRNKQKHSGKCTSVASNDSKDIQVVVCCTAMLSRRQKKKADTEVTNKHKKTSRMGSGSAMVVDYPNAQSKKTNCDKALKKLTAQSSGGKGTVSSRFVTKEESLREITKHEESEIPHQHQQSWQATEASALGALSSDFSVDLSRFGSESQRHHEMMVASSETSLVGNDSQRFVQDDKEFSVDLSRFGSESKRRHGMMVASSETSLAGNASHRSGQDDKEFSVDLSRFGSESQRCHGMMVASSETSLVGNDVQRFGQDDKKDFAQAPPQNALLLIRNRKANDQPEVASSSVAAAALPNEQETSLPAALDGHVMNKTTGTEFYRPTSRLHTFDQELLSLSGVEMKRSVMIADILGQTSSVVTCGPSSMACKSEKFEKSSLQTEHSGAHRQAPLPKPSLEASIWQRRRGFGKPCALDIKKPIRAELKQCTIIQVNEN